MAKMLFSDLEKVFISFSSHGRLGKGEATGIDGNTWSKLCRDCKVIDGKQLTATDVDIAFNKVKVKTERKINFKQFQDALADLANKRFKDDAAPSRTEKMFKLIVDSKTSGVDRVVNTSKYTGGGGNDESGKGKDSDGRLDMSGKSGYVGGYKE